MKREKWVVQLEKNTIFVWKKAFFVTLKLLSELKQIYKESCLLFGQRSRRVHHEHHRSLIWSHAGSSPAARPIVVVRCLVNDQDTRLVVEQIRGKL